MNHMLGSTILLSLFFNNSTYWYTTYPVITECRISDLMCVFHGQQQASSAAKLRIMQCYFYYRVLSQNLPNKTEHCCIRNKSMYLFLFSCFRIFSPLSLKVGYINSGLFLHSSIRPPVRLYVIQPETQSLTEDILKALWVSTINFHILTLYGLKKTNTDFEVKGQGNNFQHSVSCIYKHFIKYNELLVSRLSHDISYL